MNVFRRHILIEAGPRVLETTVVINQKYEIISDEVSWLSLSGKKEKASHRSAFIVPNVCLP